MPSKSERTKQFIIEKAAPIFNQKGYAATSMSDILEATGMAKGGIYGNFQSKDELAISVFEYANQQLVTAISGKIRQQRNALDKLTAILDFYHDYALNPLLKGGCPLLNTAIDSDHTFPKLQEKVAVAFKVMLDSLVHIIKRGIDSKELRPDIDAVSEAMLIFSVIEGGMVMSRVQHSPHYLNKLLAYLKKHIESYH